MAPVVARGGPCMAPVPALPGYSAVQPPQKQILNRCVPPAFEGDPRYWSEVRLSLWLTERGLPAEIGQAFEAHLVNGLLGVDLSEEDLASMGISNPLQQRRVILELQQLFNSREALAPTAPPDRPSSCRRSAGRQGHCGRRKQSPYVNAVPIGRRQRPQSASVGVRPCALAPDGFPVMVPPRHRALGAASRAGTAPTTPSAGHAVPCRPPSACFSPEPPPVAALPEPLMPPSRPTAQPSPRSRCALRSPFREATERRAVAAAEEQQPLPPHVGSSSREGLSRLLRRLQEHPRCAASSSSSPPPPAASSPPPLMLPAVGGDLAITLSAAPSLCGSPGRDEVQAQQGTDTDVEPPDLSEEDRPASQLRRVEGERDALRKELLEVLQTRESQAKEYADLFASLERERDALKEALEVERQSKTAQEQASDSASSPSHRSPVPNQTLPAAVRPHEDMGAARRGLKRLGMGSRGAEALLLPASLLGTKSFPAHVAVGSSKDDFQLGVQDMVASSKATAQPAAHEAG